MCLHSCGSIIHVTDDGVVNKIEGDPTNPSNNGKLCPKGNAAIMRHYDPNRFKQPLKRTNPEKGANVDPMWEPISWDEALDTVARELKKSIDEDPRCKRCQALQLLDQRRHRRRFLISSARRSAVQLGGQGAHRSWHALCHHRAPAIDFCRQI
jgi:anaerobic selenocysteine-containing dehydrogenase